MTADVTGRPGPLRRLGVRITWHRLWTHFGSDRRTRTPLADFGKADQSLLAEDARAETGTHHSIGLDRQSGFLAGHRLVRRVQACHQSSDGRIAIGGEAVRHSGCDDRTGRKQVLYSWGLWLPGRLLIHDLPTTAQSASITRPGHRRTVVTVLEAPSTGSWMASVMLVWCRRSTHLLVSMRLLFGCASTRCPA